MLNEPVLVDTGAFVALYEVRDTHHQACTAQVNELPVGKAYTCWPVITEASYLLRAYPKACEQLLQTLEQGVFMLLPLTTSDLEGIRTVFATYHDQDVDLADACLVHLGNRENIETVFTLDRRHFSVYRLENGNPFRILPEAP